MGCNCDCHKTKEHEPIFLESGPKSWTERQLDDAFYYNGHMQHTIIYLLLKKIVKALGK